MDDRRLSKLLSLVLRHEPGRLDVELDPAGWVPVDVLLSALGHHGVVVSRAQLERVVAKSDKQRFTIDREGDRIRANQGHSVAVDLGLRPLPPPDRLYHGTAERNVERILRAGLLRVSRHAVHLSPDVATATTVGARHGRPVVLVVDSGRMHADGHLFTRSDNGVWLTESVPPAYLRLLPSTPGSTLGSAPPAR